MIFFYFLDDWKSHAKAWQARLDAQQRENAGARTALATAEERQRELNAEVRQLRAALQAIENKYLDALLATETLRGEIKVALDEQQRLRQLLERERQPAAER